MASHSGTIPERRRSMPVVPGLHSTDDIIGRKTFEIRAFKVSMSSSYVNFEDIASSESQDIRRWLEDSSWDGFRYM